MKALSVYFLHITKGILFLLRLCRCNHKSFELSKDINHIIVRVLAGEANADEILLFHDWLGRDENNRLEFLQIKEYWETPIEVHGATIPEIAFEKCREKLTPAQKPPAIRHKMRSLSIAATVAILILGSMVAYLLQRDNPYTGSLKYYTYLSADGTTQFTLPDGSNVHLNYNSKLTYSNRFGSDERKVQLDGEAYFDVVKNGNTFRVALEHGEIEVMGTRFNVHAYPGDSVIVATLESGSIFFKSGDQQVMMAPGQQLSFHIAGSVFDLHRVESEIFTAWKDEIHKFRSVTMQEVCSRLEQVYGVKIMLSPALKDTRVSGSYEYKQSIDQILNVMKKSRAFTWKRKGDIIVIQ